jgi:hypothetical protein
LDAGKLGVFLLSERRPNQLLVQLKKKTLMCAESFVFFFQLVLFGSGFVVEEEGKFLLASSFLKSLFTGRTTAEKNFVVVLSSKMP